METFSPKLDKISENIIYLLSINSKITISKLSKKLSLNRKIIENRVKKLYQNGFVNPLLIYNHNSLIKATILLKLSKFDEEIIKAIIKLKDIVKLKETLGYYDLSLLIITENEKELYNLLNKINNLLHSNIQNMDTIIHKSEETPGYKSFCNNFTILQKFIYSNFDKKYYLEKEDKIILNILKIKPDISYKELIKKTKWNYLKIKKTINNLLKKGIIKFSIDPDYQKLGVEFHNILVKINLANANSFEKNIIKHNRVHWIKKGMGRWDYILSICSRDISEFIEISREIRSQNKEYILDSTSLISNIHITRKL